jgi:adenylosuccinate lyase
MENTLCPLDDRYKEQVAPLQKVMGAQSFSSARVRTECLWLILLCGLKLPHVKPLTAQEKKLLEKLPVLSEEDISVLHALEHTGYKNIPATRHDVKAVEYFLKLRLEKTSLKDRLSFLHFALTSEDINSISYAVLLSDGIEKVILPALENIRKELLKLAKKEARSVLLARTHGQAAVPTTFGKEIRVFEYRLSRQIVQLKKQQISCKFSGAVGNFNAHTAAFPHVNWRRAAGELIALLNKGRKNKLFLSKLSTQIDNRDTYAELFDNLRRTHVILLDFCRDMWQYISAGLVTQKTCAGEVGSSTMPQKVNPIDFENAEGNLQLADKLLTFFSEKLPLSRLQRDLSDSTVLRNMGMALGYGLVAYTSVLKGLSKISFNRAFAREELKKHPEVLAEGIQTILRAEGFARPYETLRDFTRGKQITQELLTDFINGLAVSTSVKERLLALTVENYTGIAGKLAEEQYD